MREEEWDVSSKTAIVTGANQGIGKETAAALAALGVTVFLACRNLQAADEAAREIRIRHPGAKVEVGPPLDLVSQRSVRQFAREWEASGRPLHILVNNAGINYTGMPWTTEEGVGGVCQVNYLGHYMLTRLLEGTLLASAPSRVVNVSSVTHRYGCISGPVATFLQRWEQGSSYAASKLANVLFAYELQRRLGEQGVQSCAVDPGGVATNIFSGSVFSRPPLSWAITALYAPPSDGAQAVVHAATAPWKAGSGSRHSAATPRGGVGGGGDAGCGAADLRFYARGLFAAPWVTSFWGGPEGEGGGGKTPLGLLKQSVWVAGALLSSLLDWPLRRVTGGRLMAATRCVPSAPLSYDQQLGRELWEESAAACRLPAHPQASKKRR